MEKRSLGGTGIKVHPIGLGLWAAGNKSWGPTDDAESLGTIDRALDLGIDFFDTADVYGDGHSETLVGKAMKGRRDRFVLGTKIGWVGFDGDAGHSAYTTPDKVIEAVEQNLRRLSTDYIDLLQWHVNFHEPTMENFIEGCERLKTAGKIRGYGVSSSDQPYIESFFGAGNGQTLQIDYSILNRTAEEKTFPYCREKGIGTVIRGGLAMGLLTGKFDADSTFGEGDFRNAWKTDEDQKRQFLADLETVTKLKKAFGGTSLAQLALRFIISNPDVSVVIPGAKRVDQLEANAGAAEAGPLTQEEMARIDAIVSPAGGRKIWPA